MCRFRDPPAVVHRCTRLFIGGISKLTNRLFADTISQSRHRRIDPTNATYPGLRYAIEVPHDSSRAADASPCQPPPNQRCHRYLCLSSVQIFTPTPHFRECGAPREVGLLMNYRDVRRVQPFVRGSFRQYTSNTARSLPKREGGSE